MFYVIANDCHRSSLSVGFYPNPIKDLDPIADVAVTTFAIAVHPAVPAHTLKELVDHAKANPGKVSYGSAGAGTLNHLTGELLH